MLMSSGLKVKKIAATIAPLGGNKYFARLIKADQGQERKDNS